MCKQSHATGTEFRDNVFHPLESEKVIAICRMNATGWLLINAPPTEQA